jgi:group I intron endonuclease
MNGFTGYIYSITNLLNGHTYIGKTNDVDRRWKEHRYGHGGTAILNKAFKKYGLDNFLFNVVAEIPFDSIEELNDILAQLEVYYIELYNTFYNGYNATIGGDGTSGYKQSSETTEKIRQANLGRVVSEETREKISASKTGIGHTKETKEKISKALLHRDPVIYEKMAEKLRGKVRDHEMIMRAAEKRRKPVLQYDLDGNFIAEYPGIIFIDGFEGKNISACCHGKLNSTQGYIWRFKKDDNFPRKIEVNIKRRTYRKEVNHA